MKTCTKCKEEKRLDEFRNRKHSKDGKQFQCKTCADLGSENWRQRNLKKRTKQLQDYRAKNKEEFDIWKQERGCVVCEENDPICLDMHHLDPSIKDIELSKLHNSPKRLKSEREKCVVVCSNCHRKLHANRITRDKNGNSLLFVTVSPKSSEY
jgi:hypothetical protein